jgi:hypothetical protein
LRDLLQQLPELFWSQPSGTKNGAEGATIERPVIWHNHLAEWVIAAQDNMASLLADHMETNSLQRPKTGLARHNREVRHTVTRRASK